jgi:rfaE bifunctional protein nucleotidyltransferase chain/domain
MAKVVTLDEARAWRERLRQAGRTVAFANGVFDLLHVGHLRYLQGARALADALIVAVNSDASTRANKGPGRPLVTESERMELLAALTCVDVVLLFDDANVGPLLEMLKPDVHVKGTDYTTETVPERAVVAAYGGRVAIAGDSKEHSTTATLTALQALPRPATTWSWLEVAACPRCHQRLLLNGSGTALACAQCRVDFQVEHGVPVLLVSAATP